MDFYSPIVLLHTQVTLCLQKWKHPTLVPDLVLDGVNVEGEDADSLAGPPAVTKEAAN